MKNGFRRCLLDFFGVGLLKCHFKSRCTSRKISSLQSTLMHTPCRFFLVRYSTDSNLRSLPRSPSASIFMESHHVSHKSQANTIHHISHQVDVLILHDPKLIFSGQNSCCTVDVFSIVPSQANHIWKIGIEIKWTLVYYKYISLKQLIQAFFSHRPPKKT